MLNSKEIDEFGDWVSKLLSLDGERSADRLGAVLVPFWFVVLRFSWIIPKMPIL